MIEKEILRRRLSTLDNSLTILERLRTYSLEQFLNNPERYGSTERFLQLSIEATLDIGSHIISDQNLGEIQVYRDIPTLLAAEEIISQELEETWIQMIGFKNILVHAYAELDREIVYQVLQTRIEDLRVLLRVFARFL